MDIEFLRQKATEAHDPTLAETFAMDDRDPFTAINLAQIRELIANAISDLPEKEKLTVSLYYQDELTMKEIGEVMGYTESRISQMHSKAMFRLRAKLKKNLAS
jgi:RNA polymerase sigma factor for flagellar operon FliA